MDDEVKLGWNDLGDGTYLRVSQELLDDVNLGKFKDKPKGESVMWKYAAAIIVSAVLVWGLFTFVAFDLNWAANAIWEGRFMAVILWGLSSVWAVLFISGL